MNALNLHEIPGRVTVSSGNGGLPVVHVQSDFSTAEIYPHGTHVTGFQKHGEASLLFMSAAREFHAKKPIRGGVPVIFPWFGSREGDVAHGFARLAEWDLVAASVLPLGAIKLSFQLPTAEPYKVTFDVTIGSSLTMELGVCNLGDTPFTFETCLHTYFQIGDIRVGDGSKLDFLLFQNLTGAQSVNPPKMTGQTASGSCSTTQNFRHPDPA